MILSTSQFLRFALSSSFGPLQRAPAKPVSSVFGNGGTALLNRKVRSTYIVQQFLLMKKQEIRPNSISYNTLPDAPVLTFKLEKSEA